MSSSHLGILISSLRRNRGFVEGLFVDGIKCFPKVDLESWILGETMIFDRVPIAMLFT